MMDILALAYTAMYQHTVDQYEVYGSSAHSI